MKVIVAAAVAAALTGCAAKLVSSSPRSVVVSGPDWATADAQKMADSECQKHGRFARMIARPNPTSTEWVFDCVQ